MKLVYVKTNRIFTLKDYEIIGALEQSGEVRLSKYRSVVIGDEDYLVLLLKYPELNDIALVSSMAG